MCLLSACDDGSSRPVAQQSDKPNILFVIMDDVGIDQMASFGYGGPFPPSMPNMDAIAQAGIRFRNTWSEPECSPARASFFVGRYPTRVHTYQALGPSDLANAQLSPYEITVPMLLHKAGYENGLFGKFHLAGPENNEAGYRTPGQMGWDYFYGWVGGLPESIDPTAGGAVPGGTANLCGFVPGVAQGGAAKGACYFPDSTCRPMDASTGEDVAGMQCLAAGGILDPGAACAAQPPTTLKFGNYNGYYVSPLTIQDHGELERVLPEDKRARGYRTTIETNAAIDWIQSRPAGKPWMATVSYTAAHTPWQQPPSDLLSDLIGNRPEGRYPTVHAFNNLKCTSDGTVADTTRMRFLQNRMTQAMDTEFGRLLVETGIATRNVDGTLNYSPEASNTVIVIVGDNGSLGMAVKPPFDGTRAKGTAYQTGVWVPLIVAGKGVADPGRSVEHMVNGVDLFGLFNELAGIDVQQELPATRPVDSVGMQAYLQNPAQPSLRQVNYALGALNQQANGGRNGPCVVPTTSGGGSCTQIPTTKAVCEDNSGFWWGKGHDDVTPMGGDNTIETYETCAQVNQVRYHQDNAAAMYNILPDQSAAVRNDQYKLMRNTFTRFDPATDSIKVDYEYEFYEIDQATGTPTLDLYGDSKIPSDGSSVGLSSAENAIYLGLRDRLDSLDATAVICKGDGNIDGVIDQEDQENWSRIYSNWGKSRVYDFTSATSGLPDGITDAWDLEVVTQNVGQTCFYPPLAQ
jgi:hypothetical protein